MRLVDLVKSTWTSTVFQWRFCNSYRVGRTARGNNKGTALSLVAAKEKDRADEVDQALSGQEPTTGDATGGTSIFKPYKFRMEELDGFRYRAQDAWRSVTRVAIREARWDMTWKLEICTLLPTQKLPWKATVSKFSSSLSKCVSSSISKDFFFFWKILGWRRSSRNCWILASYSPILPTTHGTFSHCVTTKLSTLFVTR